MSRILKKLQMFRSRILVQVCQIFIYYCFHFHALFYNNKFDYRKPFNSPHSSQHHLPTSSNVHSGISYVHVQHFRLRSSTDIVLLYQKLNFTKKCHLTS